MFQPIQQASVRRGMGLFLRTQVAFANCEANGIKIDVPYLDRAISETKHRILDLEAKIKNTSIWTRWHEIFGQAASLMARQQLGTVLFANTKSPHPRNMGYLCSAWTPTGVPQIEDKGLGHISGLEDFASDYETYMSLNKILVTYLMGVKNGLDPNGFLHPSYSLFSVISYRTSSKNGNSRPILRRHSQ